MKKDSIKFRQNSDIPLHRQLYETIRQAIVEGQFASGTRLPASREMAGEMGVSRNTVTAAYDQLVAEGYLETRQGSGTFVSSKIPDDFINVKNSREVISSKPKNSSELSKRGKRIVESKSGWMMSSGIPRPLAPCVPSAGDFPFGIWSRLASRRLKKPIRSLFNYGEITGYKPLREAIAAHLATTRGVRCTSEQVIIVSGTQQAADLTVRILLDENETVWAEDPGYQGTRAAFTAAGAKIAAVPVDEEGLSIQKGIETASNAKLICVTPSHQYPLGTTMSLARRIELLEWAKKKGAWIFEDDYDSEFRYESRPLAALQGLDENGRVIYAGTFSKVLSPALRIGYLIVPPDLIEAFTSAKALLDRHSPIFEQIILADFFDGNYFTRHLRQMRKIYAERRQNLISAIKSGFNDDVKIAPSNAGLHLTIWLDKDTNDLEIAQSAQSKGVDCEPLSALCIERNLPPALIIGFAPFSKIDIEKSVKILAKILS